jgi:hypothetical protein
MSSHDGDFETQDSDMDGNFLFNKYFIATKVPRLLGTTKDAISELQFPILVFC